MKMKLFVGIALLIAIGTVAVQAQIIAPIIVDNRDPGFSASSAWSTGQASNDYGVDFRYRLTGQVSDPATWKANTPGGARSVSAWWPTVNGPSAWTTASYIVYHGTGSTTVRVNQALNGGKWNKLGTFNLVAGVNRVALSPWGSQGYIVLADAIQWQ